MTRRAFSAASTYLFEEVSKRTSFSLNFVTRSKWAIIKYAQSRADFINKLEIALKESSETDYWLELLYRKQKLSNECYHALKNRCGTIRRKLIASVTTAKANGGISREKA